MMENVYVIKVRTKPPLSTLYPSERRYSASTVGGLSFVHFSLGALSLLLGGLASTVQGPILWIACLVPSMTGLLAWRRWYIDRNIAIFFYGSLFSLIAAALCFVATVLEIAAAVHGADSSSSLEFSEQPGDRLYLDTDVLRNGSTSPDEDVYTGAGTDVPRLKIDLFPPTAGFVIDNMSNISGYVLRTPMDQSEGDNATNAAELFVNALEDESLLPLTTDGDGLLPDSYNDTVNNLRTIKNKTISRWRQAHGTKNGPSPKILLAINMLIASLLEAIWSALSARIALRGMRNRLAEGDYKLDASATEKRRPPPPRPDILDHDRRLSESLQRFNALHDLRNSGPRLPLPESSREFRERVERFLANQSAHRVVEGSCF